MILKDIAYYVDDSISSDTIEIYQYVTTDCLLQNKGGRALATNLPPQPCSLTHYLPGDVLIANIRPYLKKVWKADIEGGCSKDVLVIRAKENHIAEYIYALSLEDAFFENAMLGTKGTQMPRGDKDKIMEFPVFDHKQKDEYKIGSIFDNIQNKISLNSRMNAELEAMAKQLYDYWFVQFDFPDENGKPYKSSGGKMVYNSTLKREIPEGWEISTYGKEFDIKLGGTPSTLDDTFWENGTINWLNSGEVQNFPINSSEKKITEAAVRNSSTEFLPKGSVLISITRYLRVTILNIDACINQSVAGFAETDLYKYPYTYFALSAEVPRLMKLRTGAQQPHINKETVEESPFLIPSNNVLNNYYARAAPIFDLLFNQSEETKELTHLRDSLLPMLMNGQVTVE